MLKRGKLKLPETGGSADSLTDSGEELEVLQPTGYDSDSKEDDEILKPAELADHKVVKKACNSADDKRSDIEYEISQRDINLDKLQRIASTGLPDGGGLRATVWKVTVQRVGLENLPDALMQFIQRVGELKLNDADLNDIDMLEMWRMLLLGYFPPSRDLWENELAVNRSKYAQLKEELLSTPSEFARTKHEALRCDEQSADAFADGPLRRHQVSLEDHPLSLRKASAWHQYFQHTEITEQIDRDLRRTHPEMKFFAGDSSFSRKNREAMRNILILFAKLNPAIRYVQGMNEVLAPIYYVFRTDKDEKNAANAEADSFSCFVRLMGDSIDHFCEQLDNSAVGILSTLSRLSELLKVTDEQLWRHLEFTSQVKPQFYAFRWITLLLTQEFNIQSILRIWDSLLSNPSGVQEMLLRVCCAMLLCVKSQLLNGDFAANLRLLQHYPDVDMERLLQVARDLSHETSSHHRDQLRLIFVRESTA